MIFQPSKDEVRQFFVNTWQRHCEGLPLEPMAQLAADWMAQHPEYHRLLSSPAEALAQEFRVEDGRVNPFLHLSMHLSLEEQMAIDQPPGVRQCIEALSRQHQSRHAAMHEAMECLGEMLHRSQVDGAPPDGLLYLDCLRRRASR